MPECSEFIECNKSPKDLAILVKQDVEQLLAQKDKSITYYTLNSELFNIVGCLIDRQYIKCNDVEIIIYKDDAPLC